MKPSIDVPVKEVTKDKDAQTVQEICKDTGLSDVTIRRHAKKMLRDGKWKQVWKKFRGQYVQAFVRVK